MKITVEHKDVPENEIVLRCRELDDEMLHVLSLLRSGMQTICGWTEDRQMVFLCPGEVLYAESVDNRTWLYCEDAVRRTTLTLAEQWLNRSSIASLDHNGTKQPPTFLSSASSWPSIRSMPSISTCFRY